MTLKSFIFCAYLACADVTQCLKAECWDAHNRDVSDNTGVCVKFCANFLDMLPYSCRTLSPDGIVE